MSSTIKFFRLFVMFMSSRTNLAWLPERQVWATQIICINPRWPPDAILKNKPCNFLSLNVVLYVFSGVFEYGKFISDVIFALSCHRISKSKMAARHHLEFSTFDYLSQNVVQYVFIGVF